MDPELTASEALGVLSPGNCLLALDRSGIDANLLSVFIQTFSEIFSLRVKSQEFSLMPVRDGPARVDAMSSLYQQAQFLSHPQARGLSGWNYYETWYLL